MRLEVLIGSITVAIAYWLWTRRRYISPKVINDFVVPSKTSKLTTDQIGIMAKTGDVLSLSRHGIPSAVHRLFLGSRVNHVKMFVRIDGELWTWSATCIKGVHMERWSELAPKLKRTQCVFWQGPHDHLTAEFYLEILKPNFGLYQGAPLAVHFNRQAARKIFKMPWATDLILPERHFNSLFNFSCASFVQFWLYNLGVLQKRLPESLPDDVVIAIEKVGYISYELVHK